ncbi:MAG: protein-L-isoaspartate(D-aspartate) O-methyltransferase [Nitrospirae bacterium]|nr:protein-L-isoaspartate(D-aspartate) O-methyltransferase [Nitrospirota bacterium]
MTADADDQWAPRRAAMVSLIRAMGVRDQRVLSVMAALPRHRFVPGNLRDAAYEDGALPIGLGQTISQPYMVAAMTEALALTGTERVLEIGTGSGYQAAVLAGLAREVVTVERLPELADRARMRFAELGLNNITAHVADGTVGVPALAPFDAILVSAGAPAVPEPLAAQLAEGGRLVIPVGGPRVQTLYRYRKEDGEMKGEALFDCLFVPLVGRHGWPAG